MSQTITPISANSRSVAHGESEAPNAVEAHGLGKRYDKRWALSECTFSLPRGRVAALVGPNGAGKTTLLHLCIGLLRPDAGAVGVLGHTPTTQTKAMLARVGFVAQDHPLYKDFTVGETLTLAASSILTGRTTLLPNGSNG